MSWLKRVTGVQELITEQRKTNHLLLDILQLKIKEKSKGPRTKS